jgi:hypothetical protein
VGLGRDSLYGNGTLDGGTGRDRIFTGMGFDFVYAKDGYRDYINCNGEGNYRIVSDEGLDVFDRCPSTKSAAKSGTVQEGERVMVTCAIDHGGDPPR